MIENEEEWHEQVNLSVTPVDLSTLPADLKTAYLQGEGEARIWYF
jgi:hypothetical protein